jgi:hypothetical protein
LYRHSLVNLVKQTAFLGFEVVQGNEEPAEATRSNSSDRPLLRSVLPDTRLINEQVHGRQCEDLSVRCLQ